MNIDEALITYLLAQSTLTSVIDRRLYPQDAPQGTTLPYISYIEVSNVFDFELDGKRDLENPRRQLTVYSATMAQAKSLTEILKTILQCYSGTMSGLEVQNNKVLNTFLSSEYLPDNSKVFIADIEIEINYIN